MMPEPEETTRHVFVYGTLRRGGRNDIARYRPLPLFIGPASIVGTLYDLGNYPGVVLGTGGCVAGEVYAVTAAVEAELDVLEEVKPDGTGEYLRRKVELMVIGRRLCCLVYEIHPQRVCGRGVIESGDWFKR